MISGLVLDVKLDLNKHLNNKINKCNKALLRNFFYFYPGKHILTLHKFFVRPNLDYGDMIYGKPFNESSKIKLEMIQYRAAIVITRSSFSRTWFTIADR